MTDACISSSSVDGYYHKLYVEENIDWIVSLSILLVPMTFLHCLNVINAENSCSITNVRNHVGLVWLSSIMTVAALMMFWINLYPEIVSHYAWVPVNLITVFYAWNLIFIQFEDEYYYQADIGFRFTDMVGGNRCATLTRYCADGNMTCVNEFFDEYGGHIVGAIVPVFYNPRVDFSDYGFSPDQIEFSRPEIPTGMLIAVGILCLTVVAIIMTTIVGILWKLFELMAECLRACFIIGLATSMSKNIVSSNKPDIKLVFCKPDESSISYDYV